MPKIRITQFRTLTNEIASDRLVEADLEFRNGPTEVHNGPIRIDFLATSTDDVDNLITYLKQLQGQLPISEKTNKKITTKIVSEDSIEEIISVGFGKSKTQEDLIAYLRTLNFVFLDSGYLTDLAEKNEMPLKLKEKHLGWQFMARQIKVAKNPLNDKYDLSLLFAIKLIGDKKSWVSIYPKGEWAEKRELHWADESGINFKVKEKFYKFPKFMSYKERSNWRLEDRKKHDNPDYELTKFYLKCEQFVKRLKPLRKKK